MKKKWHEVPNEQQHHQSLIVSKFLPYSWQMNMRAAWQLKISWFLYKTLQELALFRQHDIYANLQSLSIFFRDVFSVQAMDKKLVRNEGWSRLQSFWDLRLNGKSNTHMNMIPNMYYMHDHKGTLLISSQRSSLRGLPRNLAFHAGSSPS